MSGQKHQPGRYVKKSSKKADSRLMEERGASRRGSESDAHRGRKQSRLHEHHQDENAPLYARPDADFAQDLNPTDQAGENHGENLTLLPVRAQPTRSSTCTRSWQTSPTMNSRASPSCQQDHTCNRERSTSISGTWSRASSSLPPI